MFIDFFWWMGCFVGSCANRCKGLQSTAVPPISLPQIFHSWSSDLSERTLSANLTFCSVSTDIVQQFKIETSLNVAKAKVFHWGQATVWGVCLAKLSNLARFESLCQVSLQNMLKCSCFLPVQDLEIQMHEPFSAPL